MPSQSSARLKWGTYIALALAAGAMAFGLFRLINAHPPQASGIVGLAKPTLSPTPQPPDYELKLKKIGVTAPVVLNVPGDEEATYLKAIEKGVAQYKGTAIPGQASNSVIFGHSSYYKNKPGDYKEVFKRLNELKKDDEVIVTHDKKDYAYRVVISKIIGDADFSVLDSTKKETLTLLTCWPPGTVAKRYVVQAERT